MNTVKHLHIDKIINIPWQKGKEENDKECYDKK